MPDDPSAPPWSSIDVGERSAACDGPDGAIITRWFECVDAGSPAPAVSAAVITTRRHRRLPRSRFGIDEIVDLALAGGCDLPFGNVPGSVLENDFGNVRVNVTV